MLNVLDNVNLSMVKENEHVYTILSLFLVLYGSLARPQLPKFVERLFENQIFRILVLALIVYRGNDDPKLSLIIAIGFTLTMNYLSRQKIEEQFQQVEYFTQNRN